MPKLDAIVENKLYKDPKSLFQEEAQERAGTTPTYEVVREWGPDHDKHFIVGVFLGDEKMAEGEEESFPCSSRNSRYELVFWRIPKVVKCCVDDGLRSKSSKYRHHLFVDFLDFRFGWRILWRGDANVRRVNGRHCLDYAKEEAHGPYPQPLNKSYRRLSFEALSIYTFAFG